MLSQSLLIVGFFVALTLAVVWMVAFAVLLFRKTELVSI